MADAATELNARRSLMAAQQSGDARAELAARRALSAFNSPVPVKSDNIVQQAADLWTGAGKGAGYPELPGRMMYKEGFGPDTGHNLTEGGIGMTSARMSLGMSDKAKLDIYKSDMERAGTPLKAGQYGVDDAGAWVVHNGERFYLNAPGVTGQDASDLLSATVAMSAPTRVLGGIGAAAGAVGRMLGVGAGAGIGSMAHDVAGAGVGSEQGISAPRAVLSAAGGVLGESVGMLASKALQSIAGNTTFINPVTAELTDAGRQFMTRNGLNPDAFTSDVLRSLSKQSRMAASPEASIAGAEAASLPVPVPQTRGMITQNPQHQQFENQAIEGTYTDEAQRVLSSAKSATDDALRQNIHALGQQMNPIGAGAGDAAANAQSKLAAMNSAQKNTISKMYKEAESEWTGFPGEEVNKIAHNVRMGSDVSPIDAPKTAAFIDQFEELAGDGSIVNAGELFRLRKRLVRTQADGGADGSAATNAKRTLDDEINRLVDDAVLSGNPQTVRMWREANKAHAARKNAFEADDIVHKLTKKKGDFSADLKVAPDKAVDAIFSRGEIFSRTVANRDMKKMRSLLGADSSEWAALREAAWLRLASKANGPQRGVGLPELSGAKFSKALDNEMLHNGLLMNTMFTKGEISTMRQLARVMRRSTINAQGGRNYSGTASSLAGIIKTLAATVMLSKGSVAQFMSLPVINSVFKGTMGMKAYGAAAGKIPSTPVNVGASGAYGAATGNLAIDGLLRNKDQNNGRN